MQLIHVQDPRWQIMAMVTFSFIRVPSHAVSISVRASPPQGDSLHPHLSFPPLPLQPSQSPPPPDPLESTSPSDRFISLLRPPFRFTAEFDSEGPLFLHMLAFKFFDGLAKLKFSFQNDTKGGIFFQQLGFITKNLSLLYDVESRNTLLKGSMDLGKNLQVRTTYNDIQVEELSPK